MLHVSSREGMSIKNICVIAEKKHPCWIPSEMSAFFPVHFVYIRTANRMKIIVPHYPLHVQISCYRLGFATVMLVTSLRASSLVTSQTFPRWLQNYHHRSHLAKSLRCSRCFPRKPWTQRSRSLYAGFIIVFMYR